MDDAEKRYVKELIEDEKQATKEFNKLKAEINSIQEGLANRFENAICKWQHAHKSLLIGWHLVQEYKELQE